MDFNNPKYFLNRELSWLEFNERVLEEAQDKTNLILERIKFLAITASNLDEFFMVRISGLMDQVVAEFKGKDFAGYTPEEQLKLISLRVHAMVSKQYNCLNRSLLPALEKEKIYFLDYEKLDKEQKTFASDYFKSTIYPILTPMAIDQSRPFPLLNNKSLNLIIEIQDVNDLRENLFAIMQVPTVIPRIIQLPSTTDKKEFIFLEDIIKKNIKFLFSGMTVISTYLFRITRNSDFTIDEEDAADLLNVLERSLKRRKWGEPVRLEIEKSMIKTSRDFLTTSFLLDNEDIYEISGTIDLTVWMGFSGIKGYDYLRNKPIIPVPCINFINKDIFEAIKEKDILIHHPYDSFDCVVDYVTTAAMDSQVLAIKQTLYRVSGNSPIVNALIKAAENGKQVTVLVELKARFDEENNIVWAKKLEKAGCHVVYGLVGLKTHCKICLVVRKEEDGIRRYLHLGTGNYNDSTAKIYTDLGLFTCKETIGQDISTLFNLLTGYSNNHSWQKIAVAPVSLRTTFLRYIDIETKNAESGKSASIIAKMNSLVDLTIIKALYKASKAGVKITLIVRGICCLRPGIPEVSENITVVSIVDRFLEHSRIFYFENNGNTKIFLSSADWMPRNLDRRVEVLFPVDNKVLQREIMSMLDVTLSDTVKLRIARPDGQYEKVDKRGKETIQSQLVFSKLAKEKLDNMVSDEMEALFKPIFDTDTYI